MASASRTLGAADSRSRASSTEQLLLRLHPDRLAVAHQDGDAHAIRHEGQVRQLEDLARLVAQLRLLLELVSLERPVHRHAQVSRRGVQQPLHRGVARAGGRLVGREADAPQPGGATQGLEDADELDGGAVRIGDDPVVLVRAAPRSPPGRRAARRPRAGRPRTCRCTQRRSRRRRGRAPRSQRCPTEKRQRSSPVSDSGEASSTSSSPWPKGTRVPADRSDANARTSSYPRSARSSSSTVPTAPVAPTTPTLGMLALGARLRQLEGVVQRPDRALDIGAWDVERDLDR